MPERTDVGEERGHACVHGDGVGVPERVPNLGRDAPEQRRRAEERFPALLAADAAICGRDADAGLPIHCRCDVKRR